VRGRLNQKKNREIKEKEKVKERLSARRGGCNRKVPGGDAGENFRRTVGHLRE